jgi:hypothetical protein
MVFVFTLLVWFTAVVTGIAVIVALEPLWGRLSMRSGTH